MRILGIHFKELSLGRRTGRYVPHILARTPVTLLSKFHNTRSSRTSNASKKEAKNPSIAEQGKSNSLLTSAGGFSIKEYLATKE